MILNIKKEMKEWFTSITLTIVLVVLIRTFLFSPVIVDGNSMNPTLHDGDRLFINKIGMYVRDIERYDVIVFQKNSKKHYIKRVIGMPGDEVHYKNNQLFINGLAIQENYIIKDEAQRDVNLQMLYGLDLIPNDYYFVLGDNRQDSVDSRQRSIGLIHKDQILGTTKTIFWPPKRIGYIND